MSYRHRKLLLLHLKAHLFLGPVNHGALCLFIFAPCKYTYVAYVLTYLLMLADITIAHNVMSLVSSVKLCDPLCLSALRVLKWRYINTLPLLSFSSAPAVPPMSESQCRRRLPFPNIFSLVPPPSSVLSVSCFRSVVVSPLDGSY